MTAAALQPMLRLQPWAQSLNGRAIDLVEPKVEQVDFREMANALSQINRFAGNSSRPVNVAHHSLIALKAARQRKATPLMQAYVVAHDGHEWILGDFITPVQQAMRAVAEEMFGPAQRDRDWHALDELKRRHDRVIWQAAGLPEPSLDQRAFITSCDIVALNTERRDFLSPCERPWSPGLAGFPPLPRREAWMSAPDAAEELWRAFRTLLPALRDGTARRAGR